MADDLFSASVDDQLARRAPLADRLRPRTLDDIVGQDHLIGPGQPLRVLIEADRLSSVVLWGPPGTGKTTLAKVIAGHTAKSFETLSAVTAGVKDVREVTARAQQRLGERGQGTILFLDEVHRFELDLTARPGKKRIARKATIAVRFGPLTIRRPKSCSDRQASPEIDLFAIEAREIDPPPGQTPIIWRLLTTHRLDSLEKAVTVIGWYRRRWDIEQLFRTLKQQGLRLEQSVLEDGNALEKLAAIALITAAITMQLVAARSAAQQAAPASRVFSSQQLIVIAALLSTRQGRTAKQRNPFPPNSLAAAAWIIARLGGWTGYQSDKSNGPITMRDGLERFYAIADGYHLAAQHLCSS